MGVSNKILAVTDAAVGLASITLGACALRATLAELYITATIVASNIARLTGVFIENRRILEFMRVKRSKLKNQNV
jgi:hypothetical protein